MTNEHNLSIGQSTMRLIAITLLSIVYGIGILIAFLVPRNWRRPSSRNGRILAIGTFHNPNWFLAHIAPLAQCGCKEVILVADGHTADLPNVKVVVPNPWVSRLISRALAKSIWACYCAIRYRPDLTMGYAIFPAAVTALVLGRLSGRPSCFQLTSGKLELQGGGYLAENRVLRSLAKPSAWIERLAHRITREFDLVVVRGAEAEHYVRELGYQHEIATITGSVPAPAQRQGFDERDIDLIFVGRMTERKRPEEFLKTVALVRKSNPDIRAIMVGDGPDLDVVGSMVSELGLDENVEVAGLRTDVDTLLQRSRVFVLTSRWEGLSIAMLEAMTAGTVPVVNDVGDLRDVVDNGDNGFLVTSGDAEEFAARINDVLKDASTWNTYSEKSRSRAIAHSGRTAITARWRRTLSQWIDFSDNAEQD